MNEAHKVTIDKPMEWIKNKGQNKKPGLLTSEYEMEIAKRSWDAHLSNNRSRSATRSKDIMERAKSFERKAKEVNGGRTSLPGSRRGSFSGNKNGLMKSPSAASNSAFWKQTLEATKDGDVNRRWNSVGKLDVSEWEAKSKVNNNHARDKSVATKEKERLIEQWVRQTSSSTEDESMKFQQQQQQQQQREFKVGELIVHR